VIAATRIATTVAVTWLRTSLVLATSFALLVPDAAHARREPAPGEAPAAAPQPVAPASPPAETVPVVVTQAPPSAPVVAAPAPAPVVSPAMVPAPAPDMHARNKSASFLIGYGAMMLGLTYLGTSALGAVAIDAGKKGRTSPTGERVRDKQRIAFGRSLLVPVVGPFVALGHTDSALKRWGATMSGLTQLASVTMLVAGIVMKNRIRRERRFGIAAGGLGGGGGVTIHGRF
jgi:hypothetical protein